MPTPNVNATSADFVRRGGNWSIIAGALLDGLQFSLVDVDVAAFPDALERIVEIGGGSAVGALTTGIDEDASTAKRHARVGAA